MEDYGYRSSGYPGTVRWPMEEIEVICGIPEETVSTGLIEKICQMASEKGKKLIIHPCLSKQEVEFRVFSIDRQKHMVVLLQEGMDTAASYLPWEIAALRDIRRVPVVASVDRKHYGTDYMAILYAAGIMDAVYEEDADAEKLTERILSRRSRKECREYYGIRSMDEVVAVLDVLGKDTMERYIRYISAGIDTQDIQLRYREVQKKLSYIEKCCLVEHLPENIVQEIHEDPGFMECQKPGLKNIRKKR